jgi:hypothetical protein
MIAAINADVIAYTNILIDDGILDITTITDP